MPRSKKDDQDDRHAERTNTKNSTGIVMAVLGAVGLVFLCLCGSIGVWLVSLAAQNVGAEGWDKKLQEQAEERWKRQELAASSDRYRAKAFLDYWMVLIQMQDLDEAYRRTTAAFQKGTSRGQFEDFIRNSPDMRPHNPGWSFGISDPPGTTRFGFILSRPGPPPYALWIVKEGNEWKLDAIEGK